MTTEICCGGVPSLPETAIFAGPGASFTETGSRPKLLPVDWENSFDVRPLSVAEVKPAGQVMRRVSPSLTCLGATVHVWAKAGAAQKKQKRRARNGLRKVWGISTERRMIIYS